MPDTAATPPSATTSGSGTTTDPSPLTVGTQFVKKYYHVLSTSPSDIDKFYKNSTSIVTLGEGSNTADVVSTDFTDSAVAGRFLSCGADDEQIRFEFEHGAIDAQASMNAGILLVVTGQVVFDTSNSRKNFVHTFFLGSTVTGPSSSKRSYYVHNDILRFLDMERIEAEKPTAASDEDAQTTAVDPSIAESTAVEEPMIVKESADPPQPVEEFTSSTKESVVSNGEAKPIVVEESPPVIVEPIVTDTKSTTDAPGYGVEESKDAVLDDEVTATSKAAAVTPGSWASLVKRTAPTSSAVSPPATPMRSDKSTSLQGSSMIPQPTSATPSKGSDATTQPTVLAASTAASSTTSTAPAPPTSSEGNNTSKANSKPPAQQQFRPKREAECTLIIKNIDIDSTEAEIKAMFEPFIQNTTASYVGCTVQGHRGIAFVDYDSPEPVLKAVKQHSEVKFTIRGKELDIYQKIFVDKNRSGGGGGRQSYAGGAGRFQGNNSNTSNGGRDGYRAAGGDAGGGRTGGTGGRNFRNRSSGGGGGSNSRNGGRSGAPASGDN